MYCIHCHGPVELDNNGKLWHIEETDEGRYIHAFTVGHMPRVERVLTDEEIDALDADAANQLPLFSVLKEYELIVDMIDAEASFWLPDGEFELEVPC